MVCTLTPKMEDLVLVSIPGRTLGVSIITATNRPHFFDNLLDNYARQEYVPREMILVLHGNSSRKRDIQNKTKDYEAVKIYQVSDSYTLGDCYNYGIEKSKYNYLAKFDDDDYYGAHHLTDAMRAFQYSDADIIGKHSRFVYFEKEFLLMVYEGIEYDYFTYVTGATMVFKKAVWKKVKFASVTIGEDSNFQAAALQQGFRIFSIDKYNYVTIRRKDPNHHTFQLDDAVYMDYCQPLARTSNFLPLVIR